MDEAEWKNRRDRIDKSAPRKQSALAAHNSFGVITKQGVAN